MKNLFSVTYEIVTPESAHFGECEESGFISESVSLRDAVSDLFKTRTSLCGGIECIEANDSRPECARWVTVCNGMEFETGAHESRSIHFPDNITDASRARLVRLIQG